MFCSRCGEYNDNYDDHQNSKQQPPCKKCVKREGDQLRSIYWPKLEPKIFYPSQDWIDENG